MHLGFTVEIFHMQHLVHLHVNKAYFCMKDFALEVLTLKQRRKTTWKLPITFGKSMWKNYVVELTGKDMSKQSHILLICFEGSLSINALNV